MDDAIERQTERLLLTHCRRRNDNTYGNSKSQNTVFWAFQQRTKHLK